MSRTRKPKATDVPDEVLDQFRSGPPMSAAEVEATAPVQEGADGADARRRAEASPGLSRRAAPSRRRRPIIAMARAGRRC